MKKTLSTFLFFICVILTTTAQKTERPNILWITFEDTSPHLIYDNSSAQTPVMDTMEKEGVRFESAFSTATICSASRSAIITGLHATSIGTGNHRSNIPFPNFIKGFPYYLKKAGYHTSNNVKTDYNVNKAKAFVKEAWTESSKTATWKNRKKGQPFFSVFNLNESHASRKFVWSKKKYEKEIFQNLPENLRTDAKTLLLPPFFRDSPKMRQHFARIYNCINYTDYKIGKILDELEKDGLKENTIVFIFSDHGEAMPRGKGNGLNLGHQVPLYVYVPEKFKNLSGLEMGKKTDRVVSFEDLATTVLALADIKAPKYMEGINMLSKKYEKQMFYGAKDGTDDARDITREVSDGRFVYSRIYNPILTELQYKNYTGRSDIYKTMRDDLWNNRLEGMQKTIFTAERPIETLYDLKNDPWETKNLAEDPQYKKQLEKMRDYCNEQILKTRDLQFIPYGEMMNLYHKKGLTPYEYKFNEKIYPLKEILPIANLSGKGKKVIKKQVEALKSKKPLVRYWALFGLKNQKEEAKKYLKEIKQIIAKDKHSFNLIEASTIAYRLDQDKKAKETLLKFALGDNLFDQWHALRNIQDYLPNQADFEPVYKQVLAKLPKKKDLPEELRNIQFDVHDTAKGALYMLEQKRKYKVLP